MRVSRDAIICPHALAEMRRRQVTEEDVRRVLSAPEQTLTARKGRVILQSRMEMGVPPKTYLLRVVVEVDRDPQEVVTVYRTSKLEKYWRKP